MWRSFRAISAALVALATFWASSASAANSGYGIFPESEQVFRHLEADPRHVQLGASYYRLDGRDRADAALGHSWGLARWYSNDDYWTWQGNVEAMAYSRFTIGGGVNDFETVDFFANLPLAIKHGAFSARLMLFHESSHLGDDYIRRTHDQGFRWSIDGADFVASYEPAGWARIYGGMNYLLHTVPLPERRSVQGGFELTTMDLGLAPEYPTRLYFAQDVQSHERVRWNLDSHTVIGVQIGPRDVPRAMRVHTGYFVGHSPYGQFYFRPEHYWDLGLSFLF